MSNKDQRVENASNDLDLGFYNCLDAAALANRVPKSTLGHRRAGRPSIARIERKSQRLNNEEEKVLVQWLRDLQKQHQPPTFPKIRAIIEEVLRNRGDLRPLGKHYITRLLARHTDLKKGKSRAMDVKRLSALDSGIVSEFFDEFERLRDQYKINLEDIWNMDETGFQMGQTHATCVVFDPAVGRPTVPGTGNTKWVSIIECISHERVLKPYMIFDGKFPEEHMFPSIQELQELPDCTWAFSPKGWTDSELAKDWLRQVFIPKTLKQGRHSILILDNQDSHITGEFQYLCFENNIHTLFLPAHASHKLQPLNVGPFSPLSKKYSHLLSAYTPTGLATLNRASFTQIYIQARTESFTERNIRAGWKRAGLMPLNRQRLLDEPQVRDFGRTTPETQPPPVHEGPNHVLATPKKLEDFEALRRTVSSKLSPLSRRHLEKLEHSAVQEHTQAVIVQNELKQVRQLAVDTEVRKRSKRIQKGVNQRSWQCCHLSQMSQT